jgi:hypothetical protein
MIEKKKQHYLDNKEFLYALVLYRKELEQKFYEVHGRFPEKQDRSKKWEGKPKVNDYIGGCFLKIATHLSYRPNFINYMYKDDMVCDGIENCIQYVDNFDPAKSTNPFAYFTQIVYYAFLRRIAKEKRQMDIKDKLIERTGYEEVFSSDSEDFNNSYNQIKSNIEFSSRYSQY